MKVAVIGAGISGNVAAYHLNQSHDITVYESAGYIGGHTHTHDVLWGGVHYAIDSGFIVFNDRTYPNFMVLLETLGVRSTPTEMSFSFKDERNKLEYNGHSINTLFAQRRNLIRPKFYRLIRDILLFNQRAPALLKTCGPEITLGEYLAQSNYSKLFEQAYILPMGAAIWSTDIKGMLDFPARFFVRFFQNHGLLSVNDRPQWYVVKGGSREYVKPLVESFKDKIRLNAAVKTIKRHPDYVEVCDISGKVDYYDTVFMATHSDQALKMLDDPSSNEMAILGSIQYQANEAILHTDTSVLPRSKRAWAAWNYHASGKAKLSTQSAYQSRASEPLAVTYNMNILQHLNAPVEFCVTLNPGNSIKKEKIIDRVHYDHPLYTPDSVSAQQRLPEINGVNRTYYCGAYWANGFHEDGVVSALNALNIFDKNENKQSAIRRAS